MDNGGVKLKEIEEFLNDIGTHEKNINDMLVLFDDESDIKYFANNILDLKEWHIMYSEMKLYKLFEQGIMSVEEFDKEFNNNEVDAIKKLFRSYITEDEWTNLKEIMRNKGLSHMDLYYMQYNNLHKKDITNAWQLVL